VNAFFSITITITLIAVQNYQEEEGLKIQEGKKD
jgi:hypothetical protein